MSAQDSPNLTADLILAGLKLSERDLLRDKFSRPGESPSWGGVRLSARENFLAELLADPELAEACRPFFSRALEQPEPDLEQDWRATAGPPAAPSPNIFPWSDYLPASPGSEAQPLEELSGEEGLPLVLDFLGRALTLMAGAALAGTAPLDERYLYTRSLDGRPIRQLDSPDFDLTPQAISLPRQADRVLVLGFVRTPAIMGMNPVLSKLRPLVRSYAEINWLDWPGQIAATLKIAAWIRAQGYLALPSAGGLLMADHLGALAGLGELGRQGLLISPEYGPNLRLMTIVTDFPFEIGRPAAFGVADYCETCQRCINECPAKALAEGRRRPGLYQWPVNRRACFDNWLERGDPCRKCIEICPYTKDPLVGSPGGAQRPAP